MQKHAGNHFDRKCVGHCILRGFVRFALRPRRCEGALSIVIYKRFVASAKPQRALRCFKCCILRAFVQRVRCPTLALTARIAHFPRVLKEIDPTQCLNKNNEKENLLFDACFCYFSQKRQNSSPSESYYLRRKTTFSRTFNEKLILLVQGEVQTTKRDFNRK